jgi:hypothetical protein
MQRHLAVLFGRAAHPRPSGASGRKADDDTDLLDKIQPTPA